jgi:succinate dehydrogenase / fumarate reductase, cytochrome b subunit
MPTARPKHLNLFQIRQPAPAIVSILHRVSGALLFPESFAETRSLLGQPLVKVVLLGLLWAYLHHTFAGIRHLGLDLRLGIDLPQARASAFAVLALSFGLTVVLGVLLW